MKAKRTSLWPSMTHATRIVIGAGAGIILLGAIGLVLWLRTSSAPALSVSQTQVVQAAGLSITLGLDDTVMGPRAIEVRVHDLAGRPVDASRVHLRFSMAEMDMGTIEAEARPVGPGRFQAEGSFFTMVGSWVIEATVMRDAQAPVAAAFTFPIAIAGEASGPLNPLRADEPTLAAGRLLYENSCASCHGLSGKGDGPAALGLRPRPGDLTEHMRLGKHTDGQIYLWIHDGYPNSAMPAWGQQLSDEQIWQLVTYLRTLAQASPPSPDDALAQATAAPLASPTAVAAAAPEPLPPLIFTRAGNLWRSDGGERAPQQLTTLEEGSFAQYPATSPGGDRLAFIITSQGPLGPEEWPQLNPETRLAVMRADGSELQVLWDPERGVLGQPVWAPDGGALYVAIADVLSPPGAPVPDRLFQIVRVDLASGARTVALEDAYDLTFSRDGRRIAFLRWKKDLGAFTLNSAAPDGSDEREVIPWGTFSDLFSPRFSPDGRQLLFISPGGPPTDEQGYPIVQREQSPLERVLGLFAPDSAEAHGALADPWIVNVDGTGLRRLKALREDSPMAIFAPDGERIVVMGASGIYVINVDGTNLQKIDPVGDHGGLDWARP